VSQDLPIVGLELLPLTVPEVRRLLVRLIWNDLPSQAHILAWSRWRRRHQARARHFHYRTRLARLNGQVRL
jgi:hypothetical protein